MKNIYNVTCVCTGDAGKPPPKLIFQKYRRDHVLSMNYTATETSIQELPEHFSYYRTSNITFMVTAADNKAFIRCAFESTLAEENMYVESEPLDVKCMSYFNYLLVISIVINVKRIFFYKKNVNELC